MCLCASIIGPDLGSIAHTVSLVVIFSPLSVYGLGVEGPDFLEEISEKIASAHAQLGGLD